MLFRSFSTLSRAAVRHVRFTYGGWLELGWTSRWELRGIQHTQMVHVLPSIQRKTAETIERPRIRNGFRDLGPNEKKIQIDFCSPPLGRQESNPAATVRPSLRTSILSGAASSISDLIRVVELGTHGCELRDFIF